MRPSPSLAIVLTLAGAPATVAQPAARRVATEHVNWSEFLERQDLVWTRLPSRWGESVFIGNGRLGAGTDFAKDPCRGTAHLEGMAGFQQLQELSACCVKHRWHAGVARLPISI